jgi:hypothetical protein
MIDTTTFVSDAWKLFSWRMTSNHVSPWERSQLRAEIREWSGWSAAWCARAERHVERGDEAASAGRRETAASAHIRAGLFYHWASFLCAGGLDQFRAALENAEAAFAKAAPLADHPMDITKVPFEGTQLRGYFRRPRGATGRVPVIVLTPGADSTKEELYDLGEHILRRGIAVYDMPPSATRSGLTSSRSSTRSSPTGWPTRWELGLGPREAVNDSRS